MIRIATMQLQSVSAYSSSRKHDAPKAHPKESADAYDIRTWREHAHYDSGTLECYIPGICFKFACDAAAKMLAIKIPEKGNQTYTKRIAGGVLALDNLPLGVKRDELEMVPILAHANGVRGSGKRVTRRFPIVNSWQGVLTMHLLADDVPEDVFERIIKEAGALVGVGRYRPENAGVLGRFKITSTKWTNGV